MTRFNVSKYNKKGKNEMPTDGLCTMCGTTNDNSYLGQLLSTPRITVHENCLLFSPLLNQLLEPDEKRSGFIIGFKITDIEREVKRIARLRCKVCRGSRAGVGCCSSNCRKSFHLGCGLNNDALGIFKDNFQFYCAEHATPQSVEDRLASCEKVVPECTVCLESLLDDGYGEMNKDDRSDDMWSQFLTKINKRAVIHGQCCSRCWVHRSCMRQYGLSAGLHHTKCPNCGDKDTFIETVQQCGIWLPDRDASWELEPDAYRELYEEPPEEITDTIEPIPEVSDVAPTPQIEVKDVEIPNTPVLKSVEPFSRKRCRPADWSSKSSPTKPIKRRRKSKEVMKEGVLIHRKCAKCFRSIVSLNCKNLPTRSQLSVLKDSNHNEDSESEYVCVSCAR